MTAIVDNLNRVRDSIAAACARAGRDPSAVTLIAVSKTHPAALILEAAEQGVQHFGENRVEEASDKIPAVRAQHGGALTWHMIGHIQSRKARDVVPLFDIVHSLDSLKLAERLSRFCGESARTLDVLLEVNVSGEASKGGFAANGWERDAALREALWRDFAAVAALPGLRLRGIMTMAPIVADVQDARPTFASLAALRETASAALKLDLPDLSMGMTDDYPVAIEEGATLVRIGRAIFGERERT